MKCEIELLPAAPELGLGGNPIWGGSVLSGRPLSRASAACEHTLVQLAGKVGRLRPEDSAEAMSPAISQTEMKGRLSFLGLLGAWMVALLPGFAARFCVRTLGVCGGVDGLRDLLPPAPLVLAGADPKVRVRERLSITLGHTPLWDGEGSIAVSMDMHGRSTANAITRYRKSFGAGWGVSAGYLLFHHRLALRWQENAASSFFRATSRNMLALSDLSAHPAIMSLAAPGATKTAPPTLALQIEATYKPESSDIDTARLHKLLTLAARIPSEEGYRGLCVTATLNPEAAALPTGEITISDLDITLPHEYPPIQSCVLSLAGVDGRHRPIRRVEIVVASEGSSARMKVLENAVLAPGCCFTLQLTFRHDADLVGSAAGQVQLRASLAYRHPLAGLGDISHLPVSGHLAGKAVHTTNLNSSYDLSMEVAGVVPLNKLLFSSSLRWPSTVHAGSCNVDMAFMRDLANRMSDEGIEVRSMLESQVGAYADGSFLCDLHGRYEKSMAGPDVHIRVLRSREGGADRPSTRFELTVLGRAEGEVERSRIENVNRSICDVLAGVAGAAEGATVEPIMPFPAGEIGDTLPASTLDRIEALITQLAQMVGSLRRTSTERAFE